MELFKQIVEKLSPYEFITNLLPGTVLCIILQYLVGFNILVSDSIFVLGILFYFVGIVSNRFGSVCMEKVLKKCKFLVFVPYDDYIIAEKKDEKVALLNTINNSYRSYLSVIVLSLFAFGYKALLNVWECLNAYSGLFLLAALFFLFLFSYRKQTSYVRERVKKNLKND